MYIYFYIIPPSLSLSFSISLSLSLSLERDVQTTRSVTRNVAGTVLQNCHPGNLL